MASSNQKMSILLVLILVVVLCATKSYAGIAKYDDYLRARANQSRAESLQAFDPNPEKIADDLNEQVEGILMSQDVRRHLSVSGCKATNPIDRCWRCDPNWANNRKRLADCARGFAHRTTGGKNGEIYVVTDPSDDDLLEPKPGTLRYAVIQTRPLWIIFARAMVIRLQQELICTSDKTIDGRGVEVHIAYGAGITLQYVHNVIIHNIRIHNIVVGNGGMIRDALEHIGLRTMSDGDAISIFGSNNIWIDHVSMARAMDGLVDAIEGSTAITISNCKFNHHDHVILLGAHDSTAEDKIMQVTIAFNRFGAGLIQRMPRCRSGFFHVINNYYSRWEMYAIGGSANPTIISQGNRFKASNNSYTKEVTKRENSSKSEWEHWQWRSEGDKFTDGAFFVESGPEIKHTRTPLTIRNTIKYKPGSYAGRLTRSAGTLKCKVGIMC